MLPDGEKTMFHIRRIEARLGADGVVKAFEVLLRDLADQSRFELEATSHGAFSALALRYGGRRCHEFRGTRNWIAWYFRKPAFQQRLTTRAEVLETFRFADPRYNARVEEVWVKIRTPQDAKRVLSHVLN